ncbi:MAG: HI0074 family nucleotidyltransferase substrate-binding subunit [Bacteroidota bacterium]
MESSAKFTASNLTFQKSVAGLEKLLPQNFLDFDPVITDGLKNGCIQKFEYSIELGWKLMRSYLHLNGTEINSPKPVVKSFYENGFIDEEVCEHLLIMMDDRNSLPHVYNEIYFEEIFKSLNTHLAALKKLVKILAAIKI